MSRDPSATCAGCVIHCVDPRSNAWCKSLFSGSTKATNCRTPSESVSDDFIERVVKGDSLVRTRDRLCTGPSYIMRITRFSNCGGLLKPGYMFRLERKNACPLSPLCPD